MRPMRWRSFKRFFMGSVALFYVHVAMEGMNLLPQPAGPDILGVFPALLADRLGGADRRAGLLAGANFFLHPAA